MYSHFVFRCGVLLTLAGGLFVSSFAASAQNSDASKYWLARPVYLDLKPITPLTSKVLSPDQVANMVRQALSKRDESMIVMHSSVLPDRVRVLRILYIVHRQRKADGVVMAASAEVDLLRTKADQYSTVLATSIYSGVQQSLIQGKDEDSATADLTAAFQTTLNKRITQAFTNTAAE